MADTSQLALDTDIYKFIVFPSQGSSQFSWDAKDRDGLACIGARATIENPKQLRQFADSWDSENDEKCSGFSIWIEYPGNVKVH